MKNYSKILYSIKQCEGCAITFIVHPNDIGVNKDYILSILEDLKSEYKVEIQLLDATNIKEKTVIFIEYNKDIDFTKLTENPNVILMVSRNYHETSNTEIIGSVVKYTSELIFLLKNKKLQILKSRFVQENDKKLFDINNAVRNFKLKNLENESKRD